jgi:hypothetical protein
MAGDQEPVMLLLEVVTKAVKLPPAQIGAMGVNVGKRFVATFTVALTKQPFISV